MYFEGVGVRVIFVKHASFAMSRYLVMFRDVQNHLQFERVF